MFGLSAAATGALFGLVLGLVNFIILMRVAEHTDRAAARPQGSDGARILRWVAWADLVIFPAVGYFVGPMVFA
ncbi:MAG: hypothetical protein AAF732_00265 [Pseudomonadota bacterium]